MRFAALQGSSTSDYAAAGKNAANAAASSFAITRKYGPEYDEIAKTGMKARSAEKVMAMKAGAHVTKAGINAVSKLHQKHLGIQAEQKVEGIKNDFRKAGAIAGLGKLAGAGYLASRDNTKGREIPSNTDAMRELYAKHVKNRDAKIAERDANRTEFDTSTPSTSNTGGTGGTGSNGQTGGSAGKVSTGANSLLTGNQRTVADAIAKYESGDWGYEAFNQGGASSGRRVLGKSGSHKEQFGTSLTGLTLSEIFKRQNTAQRGLSMQEHLDSGGLHAVGRYQFIGSTLQDEVRRMGLDPNTTRFTPKVQDDIFLSHIRRVGDISPWVGPSDNYSASEKANFRNMIAGF